MLSAGGVDQDVGGGDGGIIAKTLKTRGANCRSSKTINFRKFPAKMINFRKCRANPRKYQISSVQNKTVYIRRTLLKHKSPVQLRG